MTNSEFNKIYDSLVPKEFSTQRIDLTSGKMFKAFYNSAFMRANCKFLYEYFENLYGEGYSEKVLRYITSETLKLTNPESFTNPKVPYIENCMWFVHKLHQKETRINFLSAMGEMSFYILGESRHNVHVLLPDVLVVLSLLYKKYVNGKGKYTRYTSFLTFRQKIAFAEDLLICFLRGLATKLDDTDNPHTIAILDKSTYNMIMSTYKFDYRHKGIGEEEYSCFYRPSYRDYITFVKIFLRSYQKYQRRKDLTPCRVVHYIHPTRTLHNLVDTAIADFLKEPLWKVTGYTVFLYFGEESDFTKPEYEKYIGQIIKYTKTEKTFEEIVEVAKKTIKESIDLMRDRIDYESLPLYKFMKRLKLKVEKPYIPYNALEYRELFFDKRSEVVIDYLKIHDDTLTQDEQLNKIAETYVDSQAINQARLSIFKGINYTDCRCNVKLENVPKEIVPLVYMRISEENKFLRNSYSVNFTFEIERQVD